MSNPEKRDDRSMSDILASIRKIMAQEPAAAEPPSPTRAPLNGVSGGREPELKLPPHLAEGSGTPPQAGQPVSLDELLADTPRAAPPAAPSLKSPAAAKAAPMPGPQAGSAPEWLFPRPNGSEAGERVGSGPALQVPAQSKDVVFAPKAAPEPAPSSHAPKAETASPGPLGPPGPAKEAAPSAIGPPAPKLGDLGSVVPAKIESAGPRPALDGAAPQPAPSERSAVLGPPLAGPLLGEPPRAPAASASLPEVPGADALRRLIAGVIPPSAHPSVAPVAKAPEPAPSREEEPPKVAPAPKAAPEPKPEAKAEPKPAPASAPPAAKKVETPVPVTAPAPTPKPAAAVQAAAPAPKPAPPVATPAPAAKSVAPLVVPAPAQASPAPKPIAEATSGGKTMDETVVELLRPLLRQWLDANMPRLIEPALKAELEALRNASAKDKKD